MADDFRNAPPGAQDKDDINERRSLRDYYVIIRERIWIALPLALIIAIGYAYYKSRQTPMYSATATMQVEKPEKVVTSQEVVDTSINSDIELNTYLQVISSQKIKAKVVDSLTPDDIAILQRPYLKDAAAAATKPPGPYALVGTPNAQPVRNSLLLSITAYNRDPEGAQLVANRYMDQFMQHLIDNVSGRNEYAVEFLQTRADQLRKEAEAADQALQDYMKKHNLVSLDNSTNIVQDRLKTVSAALQSSRLDRLQIEETVNQVALFQKDGRNLLEIGFISNHGTVPTVKAQLAELNRVQSALAERYLERHPKMIDVASALAVAQEQLDRAVSLAIADLQSTQEKAVANEKSLQREYEEHVQEQLRLRDLAVDFNTLQQRAANAKSSYGQVLERLAQTNTSKNLEKIAVRPLDRATVNLVPFSPNLQSITRTAIGIGVMVFFGVALGLSFLDDRIKSAWDVESFIGANLLGIVPDLSMLKDDEKYQMVLKGSQNPGTESFLSVYSSVKIHSKLDFPKSILITSTIPGEGKTLVSCNLAGAFAKHGKRTLIIDCDLRRPMLHRHFNQANEKGLITWFDAGAPLEGNLVTEPTLGITQVGENFWLLTSGGRSKSPTQLLESAAFTQLLERLKKHFELVVVDSPPLGAVTDSLLIAERTDEVVYVCRFNRAFRKHIKIYIKSLRAGKNEILGVVLNGLSPRRIEYYSNYRYYRSYKKYYGTQG